MDEEMTTDERLDYLGMLLWDVLQELREANGKHRNTPDTFCGGCGEMLGDDHNPKSHLTRLS
jgi:hypothetical protein